MDTKKYEAFVRTAETENISKTAELTGYTQSGISHMLKSLEKEMGVTLFRRDRYGIHLTAIGNEVLPLIRNITMAEEKLRQYVYDVNGLERGTLTIGTFSSISIQWLPMMLAEFKHDHPQIDIRLREGGVREIESWITEQQIDLGFYSRQPDHPFPFIHLQNDPLVAVLPKEYPLSDSQKVFDINDFNAEPFILSELGVDYDINRMLKEKHIHPNVLFSSKDDHTIMSMVIHGLGISILPKLITEDYSEKLVTLPLTPAVSRDLGISLLSMEDASPIAKKFIHYAERYFSQVSSAVCDMAKCCK